MNRSHLALVGRIRDDLSEIEGIASRAQEGWTRAGQTGDDFYIDGFFRPGPGGRKELA